MRHVVLAAAVAAACLWEAPRAQVPVFVSRRDVVRLDVLVTERGRPVLGLRAADFSVTDNGVPQQVDYVSSDELPLNVVMTFDTSGSMAGARFADLRAAGHGLVDQLRREDRAALLRFAAALSLGADLTTDRGVVRAAIDRAPPGGQTALADAAFAGLVLGASDTGRSLMVVFSDGLDTSSWLEPSRVLEAARRAPVVVFGVVEGESHSSFLRDLVEVTGGDLIEVRSTRDLRAAFVRLLSEYRQRYLLGYSPSGVTAGGWHKVDVKVSRRGADVKTRAGYQGR
jgi:VWFA-related protein